MGAHMPTVFAVIIATIVFAALTALTLTSSETLSPDYFESAGKYVHRL